MLQGINILSGVNFNNILLFSSAVFYRYLASKPKSIIIFPPFFDSMERMSLNFLGNLHIAKRCITLD